MLQRPMQTHTERQAWEGHSATAHPTRPRCGPWPSASGWGLLFPTPRPYGKGWTGECESVMRQMSAHTGLAGRWVISTPDSGCRGSGELELWSCVA